MVVENMKTLVIAQNLSYIYIYIYIYIYMYIYMYIIFLTDLYFYSITTLYHSVVNKKLFVFFMFDCCNVSGSVAMVTRNHSTNSAYRRRGHIKTALGIGLRTRHRLISVSPRNIFCLKYVSASRIARLFLLPLLYVYQNLSRK